MYAEDRSGESGNESNSSYSHRSKVQRTTSDRGLRVRVRNPPTSTSGGSIIKFSKFI